MYKNNGEYNRNYIDKEKYIKYNKYTVNIVTELMNLWRIDIKKNDILRKIRLKSFYVLATPEIWKAKNTFSVQGNGAQGKAKNWNTQTLLLVAVVTGLPTLVSLI